MQGYLKYILQVYFKVLEFCFIPAVKLIDKNIIAAFWTEYLKRLEVEVKSLRP